ncbi:kinesin-like protein [Cryptosporidium ubiquitum]|uniref:Kinesin-like protein n=1 Tax=Cryptosporidium ubiquitum TaxID=857276 RepID=A0A1J4MJB2_9CRYT|nr:kinesin-like protein [Cryptosporidium ubiquitum]OII74095.1 kinesin-like protein [Cryptosporidium ubiquitum]
MNFRVFLLVLLYIIGLICCDETSKYSVNEKKKINNVSKTFLSEYPLLEDFDLEFQREDEKVNNYEEISDFISKNSQPTTEKSSFFSLFKKNNPKRLNKKNTWSLNNPHTTFKIISPSLNLQQRKYKIFPLKNKKSPDTVSNNGKIISQISNSNLSKGSLENTSSALNFVEERGTQTNGDSYSSDVRFEILKNEELREREMKQIMDEVAFKKEKIKEKIEEEREFSLVDPEEDQIETWDDTQIYKKVEPGEEKMLKYPYEIGDPKKIAIRNHPELKGYKQNDINLSEMKSRQLKHDQELEFIETSQEAQHMFETAGSPFRNVKRGIKDPLNDEDMAVLDMPLGHTPDGIRDIVEEYFWGDFPNFNYEHDRVNPPDNLAHFFDLDSNIKNVLTLSPHSSNILEPGLKDLISIHPRTKKDVKILIAERRDLLTVKDRPFSLTRSISKGFKNIFMRRKSKKAKQKFLADLRDAIIEWSNEYDKEFPMITLSPNKYISPKIIKEALNSNENKDMNLDLKQRLEFVEEMLKKEETPTPKDSKLFNIHLSRQLFPELKFEDIPDIRGIPIEELIILSSSGILPNMGDFEHTLNSLRNELIEAERIKGSFEDPLDPRRVSRHVLIKELPPISASEDELAQWEMEQREKMIQEEYDEHGHRKFKLQQLPLDRIPGVPNLKLKQNEMKVGKVVVSDEEVEKLRNYEKNIYPEYIKKTDKLSREAEKRRIAHVIDKRDQVEADLKRTPAAFKRKNQVDPYNFIYENEGMNSKISDGNKQLERPHTTAMTHLDKNFKKTIFDSSKFNYGSSSEFGDNLNDYIEAEDYIKKK